MRKLIFSIGVSLDGYFEGPNREIDWHLVDDELHWHMNEWIGALGGSLEGRITFELMADYWPNADQDPDSPPVIVEFARIWRDMPKLVYSRTLEKADWNSTIVREVVPEEILAWKAQPGGDLVIGGPDLAATFLRHDLIDEFRFYVNPVVLGRGRTVFPQFNDAISLKLVETRTFGNGVVLLRYER